MNALVVQYINAKVVMSVWLASWLAFAMIVGVTRFVTADEPPREAQSGSIGGGTLVAAGLSVSARPVKMTAAETSVQIEVTGREDLGYRLADAGPATLVDVSGTRHFIQSSYLEGRTFTFTFPGSASVASGRATLELPRLALTDDPIDVAPGSERVNYVRSSPLFVDISTAGGTVRSTQLSSSAVTSRSQGATVTSVVQDDEVIVVNGHLDGFALEEIQSLSLRGTRLVLADGSERQFAGGSHGNGPERKDFSFWFELPKGRSAASALDLQVEPNVPEMVRQQATGDTRARLDALEAAGVQHVLISLAR